MQSLTFHLESIIETIARVITPTDNRDTLNNYRADYGIGKVSNRVNILRANGKLALDAGKVFAYGISLNPATTHGKWNTCMWSGNCADVCILDFAYQQADNVRNSRRALTDYLAGDLAKFLDHLAWEIEELIAKHGKGNVAVRLNTASDLRWELFAGHLLDYFAGDVLFYDYTKAPIEHRELRDDYTLVYSISEIKASLNNARKYLDAGHSATMVTDIRYRSHDDHDPIPDEFADAVVDHDIHDVRALDKGSLGLLRAKGSARTDDTGFVRPISDVRELAG